MDIFKFPFLSDIWGTVSDWVMIGVTSLTAFFLYKTLKSQKEVQQAQNKILQIEQLRVREDFRPVLSYSRYEDGLIIKDIDKNLMIGKNLFSFAVHNFSNNDALNISPIFSNDKKVTPLYIPSFRDLLKGEKHISLHFIVDSFAGNLFIYNFRFALTYQDVAGTKYKQDVLCYKSTNEEGIIASTPEILD